MGADARRRRPAGPGPAPDDLTAGDVARAFGVCVQTVGQWVDSGVLPGWRMPGRCRRRRIKADAARAFAIEHFEGPRRKAALDAIDATEAARAAARPGRRAARRETLTTGEVARLCEVTPMTVAHWIDSGTLPGFRVPGPGGDRRVLRADLIAFARATYPPSMAAMIEERIGEILEDAT